MKNPILVPELRELLHKRRHEVLRSFLNEGHPREIAEYLGLLEPSEIWGLLALVDRYRREEIFTYLDMDVQVDMISGNWRKNIKELLETMAPDKRADLFQHLSKEVADRLLVLLPVSERADVIRLTSYREDTAGAIMTTDYATLNENDSAAQAIRKLRGEAPSKETIYYLYVTDDDKRLIGFVSLRKLIVASPNEKVGRLMKRDVIYAYVNDDQEKAAGLIEEYDLLALPVVDINERLTGIITYDDAMDVIQEEQTEDLEKFMAISGGVEDKPYLEVPAFIHFRKRVFWVVILAFMSLVSGLIIQHFQKTLETLLVLTFYMPLLNATGGNTGSQSATVVLRALTLKELSVKDILGVVRKEFRVSSMLSLCLGIITFGRVYLLSSHSIPAQFTLFGVASVIVIALMLQIVWSTILGAVVPMIALKLKIDPAVVSSPLLATMVDMGGITIYFATARLILGI